MQDVKFQKLYLYEFRGLKLNCVCFVYCGQYGQVFRCFQYADDIAIFRYSTNSFNKKLEARHSNTSGLKPCVCFSWDVLINFIDKNMNFHSELELDLEDQVGQKRSFFCR